MASVTALPHDPRELEREDRGGCQDDDDVHHFRTLVLFVAFDLSPKKTPAFRVRRSQHPKLSQLAYRTGTEALDSP